MFHFFFSDPVSINCIHHTKGRKKRKSLNSRTDFNTTFHCKDLLDRFENLFRSLFSFDFSRTENYFQKKYYLSDTSVVSGTAIAPAPEGCCPGFHLWYCSLRPHACWKMKRLQFSWIYCPRNKLSSHLFPFPQGESVKYFLDNLDRIGQLVRHAFSFRTER